jgi:hypothetical protein
MRDLFVLALLSLAGCSMTTDPTDPPALSRQPVRCYLTVDDTVYCPPQP